MGGENTTLFLLTTFVTFIYECRGSEENTIGKLQNSKCKDPYFKTVLLSNSL